MNSWSMNGNNVRLQNLRDFTVQIRDANDQIVGTGIAVSADGKIATCAHVVKAAGLDPHKASGKELRVYYPQLRGGQEKNRRAKVSTCFTEYDDDLILLQLSDGYSPLGLEDMPVLGKADLSRGDPFHSYGYRRLDIYPAGWSEGIIQGQVEPPPSRKLQADPVQLKSNQISDGMSGSAVLDTERNLIIGVVSEMWFSDQSMKDSDTAWAVDGHIIYKLASLAKVEGLFFQEESLALKPAPSPKVDIAESQSKAAPISRFAWRNAPQLLEEWIGRTELLKALNGDWQNPNKHVTGLIGFGGEGKSSLARKWVDNLLKDSSQQQPDNVFWWGFYENRSVDEFLEAALNYLSGGRIDPRAVPSSNLRAQIIGAMLGTGRYLFVLDGLEVMQHQEGDQYGLLQSNDLRDLLTFFARPDNQSFCLVTSRAPLFDLIDYTTYTHRDVERLSEEDSRALLRRLGVRGSDAELDKVVTDWDGHALTLSILAAYLAERFDGDIHHLADIPIPTADEPRYERVHRILRRYDEHLTDEEREFLKLFSVFRLPVQESAFEKVFEPLLKSLNKNEMQKLVLRLASCHLIRYDEQEKSYTTHPLIRNHYYALFTKGDPSQEKSAHEQIKDYYLSIAGDTPEHPTLDDLKPLIEVVHHACQAGAYDEAFRINRERIRQSPKNVLTYELGAYKTQLALMQEFFPNQDFTQVSLLTDTEDAEASRWILNEVGVCLMVLGHLRESVPFFERYVKGNIEAQDWLNASIGYQNLADLYASIGDLKQSHGFARNGLDFAHRAEHKFSISTSLAYQGWLEHLLGNLRTAKDIFSAAETVEVERLNKRVSYLFSIRGIFYAEHLRRTKEFDYARRVTEANFQICEQQHWLNQISWCHRVLSDLDSDTGNHVAAREHYESALKIARGISDRPALIDALLARGRWQAKHLKDADTALGDLNEALGYCVESGYRIYESDVRVALAWAYLADLTPSPSPFRRGELLAKAQQSAERALQMSNEMGYHWGKVDAQEVLKEIGNW